jgi:hypothetical protein
MNRFKWIFLGAMLGLVSVAYATMPKTWSNGEKVTATDLNANFAHAESNFRDSTHTLLVNADISGSAAIAHSKLATPGLVAKIVLTVGATACTVTPCTVAESAGTYLDLTRTGAGAYSLNFSARTDNKYMVFVTSRTANVSCYVGAITTTAAPFTCITTNTAAATDAAFSVMLFDAN